MLGFSFSYLHTDRQFLYATHLKLNIYNQHLTDDQHLKFNSAFAQ